MKNTSKKSFRNSDDDFNTTSFKRPRFNRSYENRIARQEIEEQLYSRF